MTADQYRVIADRDKGDDIGAVYEMFKPGDRATYEVVDAAGNATLVRIERPAPTTGLPAPMTLTAAEQESYTAAMAEPSLPTREQAYEAVSTAMGYKSLTQWERAAVDALLALLQKGADR